MQFRILISSLMAIACVSAGADESSIVNRVKAAVDQICGVPESVAPLSGMSQTLLHKISSTPYSEMSRLSHWTRDERVQIACSLRLTFLNKYALLDLKLDRLKVDARFELDRCVANEFSNPVSSSLEFLNNMRRCVASMKDTHLNIVPLTAPPAVYAGLILSEWNGRYYILRRAEKVISHLKEAGLSQEQMDLLEVGSEVVKVDGVEIRRWVDYFSKFISASSNLHRREQALDAILIRNFAYPGKPKVELTFANGQSVELPWLHDATENAHALEAFRLAGIQAAKPIIEDDANWRGYSKSSRLLTVDEITQRFIDEKGAETLVMGRGTAGGKPFCYVQLRTFGTLKWKTADDAAEVEFEVPIRDFVSTCEADGLPLVLDLNTNDGGYTYNVGKFVPLFLKPGQVIPGRLHSYPATEHSKRLLADDPVSLEAVNQAISEGKAYSHLVRTPEIAVDEISGGFTGNLLVLISTSCVSTCEIVAGHLKHWTTAKLIGTHTSGTGAAFTKDNKIDSTWKDSAFDSFEVLIPNMLFGVAQKAITEDVLTFDKYKSWLMENRPVTPTIWFKLNPQHYKTYTAEWLREVGEHL